VKGEPGVPRGKEKKGLFCKVDSGARSKALKRSGKLDKRTPNSGFSEEGKWEFLGEGKRNGNFQFIMPRIPELSFHSS
jgi:hypothetical protein